MYLSLIIPRSLFVLTLFTEIKYIGYSNTLISFFERERERVSVRESEPGGGERERENPKQAPYPVQSPTRASNSGP